MATEPVASVFQVNPSKFLYRSAIMTASTYSSRTVWVSRSCAASQWLRLICRTFSAIFENKFDTPIGLDNVPGLAIKTGAPNVPEIFKDTYNAGLSEVIFQAQWKVQRFVLLPT